MIPYLIISYKEFKNVFLFKLHPLRYLRAVFWYIILGIICYCAYLLYTSIFRTATIHDLWYWIYYGFVTSIYFFNVLSIALFSNVKSRNIKKNEIFISEIAVLIACHNSEDVLPHTIKNILYTFKPEQIYIADNNNSIEPTNSKTKDICDKYHANYQYHPIGNKGNALNKTIDVIDKKYKYILTLDDDTLLPPDFSPNNEFFNDKRISSIGFGIKIKDKTTLSEKMADFEYKLNSLRDYVKNDTTNFFIIGIAGLWRRKIFHEIIAINPTAVKSTIFGKSIGCYEAPHGEDSYNGLISRMLGYKQKMDLDNFVETYAPPRFFYNCNDIMCKTQNISGYNSFSHYSQRALRWYRSQLTRLPYEFFLFFTFDASTNGNGLFMNTYMQIKYRYNFIWKYMLMYFAVALFINVFLLAYNGLYIEWILLHIAIYVFGVFSNTIINYVIFRNRPDLQIEKIVIFTYPIFTTYVTICRLIGILGAITFHIPFRTPFYFSFCKYINHIDCETFEITEEFYSCDKPITIEIGEK